MKIICVELKYCDTIDVPDDWDNDIINEYIEDNTIYALPNIGLLEEIKWEEAEPKLI